MVKALITSRLRLFCRRCVVVVPLLALISGCNQADAPQMSAAPPPPEPKAEELKIPKTGAGKAQYGASEKYQRAMEKLGRQGRGE
jgi:hypothetical protein